MPRIFRAARDRHDGQLPGFFRRVRGARYIPRRRAGRHRAAAAQRPSLPRPRATRPDAEGLLGRGLGRAVRRGTGRRLGVSRTLRAVSRGVSRVAPAAAGGSGRGRRGRPCSGNHPRCGRARRCSPCCRGSGFLRGLSYTIDGTRTRAGQRSPTRSRSRPESRRWSPWASTAVRPTTCCRRSAWQSATGKPVIVYPNSGERWDGRGVGRAGAVQRPTRVRNWVAAGAANRRRMLPGGAFRYSGHRPAILIDR